VASLISDNTWAHVLICMYFTEAQRRIVAHVVCNSLPVHVPADADIPRQRPGAAHGVRERELLLALAGIGRVAGAGGARERGCHSTTGVLHLLAGPARRACGRTRRPARSARRPAMRLTFRTACPRSSPPPPFVSPVLPSAAAAAAAAGGDEDAPPPDPSPTPFARAPAVSSCAWELGAGPSTHHCLPALRPRTRPRPRPRPSCRRR
jgi:hypothetical protein